MEECVRAARIITLFREISRSNLFLNCIAWCWSRTVVVGVPRRHTCAYNCKFCWFQAGRNTALTACDYEASFSDALSGTC